MLTDSEVLKPEIETAAKWLACELRMLAAFYGGLAKIAVNRGEEDEAYKRTRVAAGIALELMGDSKVAPKE